LGEKECREGRNRIARDNRKGKNAEEEHLKTDG